MTGKQPGNLVDKRLNCVSPSLLFINRHFWENEQWFLEKRSSDEPPDYLLLCSPRLGPPPPPQITAPSAAALPAVRYVIHYICDVMWHMTCKSCGLIRDLRWTLSPWDGGGASITGGIKKLTSGNGSSGIVHSSFNHTWTANCPLWKAVNLHLWVR